MTRNTTIRALALVAAAGVAMTACTGGGSKNSGSSGSGGVSTLVVENNPVPSFKEDFNPFDGNAFSGTENANSLIYEPLFQFNTLKGDQPPIPWLAKTASWSNGNKTLTLALQSGVKWSDGKPFTSADVKFTVEMVKKNAAANTTGAPSPTSITTPDATTVVLNYSSPQSANFNGIGGQMIVPEHIWSTISNPATAVIKADQAIGTGPYLVDKFTAQNVTYKVNPAFRLGAAKVKRVSFPAYATNDAATLALTSGKIDLTGNNINNVQNVFVARDPAHNHLFQSTAPYFPAGNVVSLFLNTKSSKAPALADQAVRKAISAGLNRASYASQCETDYEAPATSSGGLLLPADQDSLNPATTGDLKAAQDEAAVTSLLSGAGYSKSGGKWTKNGKTIKFTIIDPNSFTDYWCGAQAMAGDLNKLGFDVSANGAFDFNSWNTAITTGDYDAALHWGQGGTPFQRLQYVLDPALSAPQGKAAAGDFSHFDTPEVRSAVAAYENATDDAAKKTALNTLQQIFSAEVPAVPVLYGASWYEYSDLNFTGWPTSQNPYINPAPNSQAYEYLILHLTPRG